MGGYIGTKVGSLSVTAANVTGDATIGGDLTVKGTTITVDSATAQTVDLGDNDKIRLGDDDDLQIYHDGSNSYIQENGTGNLRIRATDLSLEKNAGGEYYLQATADGAVRVYHDGSQKLLTTSTGVDVTGTLTTDDITLSDADTPTITLTDTTNNLTTVLQSGNSTAIFGTTTNHDLRLFTNNAEAMRIRSDGIVSINDSTDPTAGGFAPLLHMKQKVDGFFSGITIEDDGTDKVGGFGWTANGSEFAMGASFRSTGGYEDLGFYTNGARMLKIDTSNNLILRNGLLSTQNHYDGSITFADFGGATNTYQNGPGIEGSASDGNGRRDAGCRIVRTPGTGGGTTSGVGVGFFTSSNTYSGYNQNYNNTLSFIARAYQFIPAYDNESDLGNSSLRWDDIYATNSSIQTSDQREKQQIATLTDAEMTAAKAISGLFKTYKWNSAVSEKGDNARIHTGVVAQDVVSVMEANGLDASRYAFFTSNTWWEETVDVPAKEEIVDEDGLVRQVAQPATTQIVKHEFKEDAPEGSVEVQRFGIRYPELLSFIGAATEQRLTSIEARLDALEG